MDETGVKTGRERKGKMRHAYLLFRPLYYADQDKILFIDASARDHRCVKEITGNDYTGTLLSDGYVAYERYAETPYQRR